MGLGSDVGSDVGPDVGPDIGPNPDLGTDAYIRPIVSFFNMNFP